MGSNFFPFSALPPGQGYSRADWLFWQHHDRPVPRQRVQRCEWLKIGEHYKISFVSDAFEYNKPHDIIQLWQSKLFSYQTDYCVRLVRWADMKEWVCVNLLALGVVESRMTWCAEISACWSPLLCCAVDWCCFQLHYSAEEHFENILKNQQHFQKKRLRKLRVKVNKEE